jgi:Tol biopolymer transport system component
LTSVFKNCRANYLRGQNNLNIKRKKMNTLYKSNIIAKGYRKILTAVCLSIFLFATAAFAQTPILRSNGKIAFTSNRDGNAEIYIMNSDGTNQVRLTNNPGGDAFPTWSPDGSKIAFVSQKQNGEAIFTMNADGTNRTEITELNCGATSLSWSPDGGRIAFDDCSSINSIDGDIFVVNLDGSGKQNLTSDAAQDVEPIWSPDGSKILFSRYGVYPPVSYGGRMLHTINVDGTNLTRLVNGFQDGWNEDSADWSPATNKIVYSVNVWDFYYSIFIANADGTTRQIFQGTGIWSGPNYLDPAWSPDGSKIAFIEQDNFNTYTVICVQNIDGTGFVQLTNGQSRNYQPSWQPLTAKSRKRIRYF